MNRQAKHLLEFGPFRMDLEERVLMRDLETITLSPKAFETLLVLVQHSERVVLKDDLMKTLWPHTFVEESNLSQHIFLLRKALGDRAHDPEYIVTVPGRGYRFAQKVTELTEPDGDLIVHSCSVQRVTVEETESTSDSAVAASFPKLRQRPWNWIVGSTTVGALLTLAAAGTFFYKRNVHALTEKDTIVLGDFTNTTGDAVFDGTLKTALNVSLRQSPFLNVLSDSEVAKTLQLMARPAGTKITPEVARELCQRAGSKAYLAGSIGSLGSEYVLELKAVNCQSGDTLAQELITAASKEKVLGTLGEAATKLRGELGESLATVQKLNVPLFQATTSSLEALQAYSLGGKVANEKGYAAELPYNQRAIELDPNFAMGYLAVGEDYLSLGELERASEYFTKAFQLREHASERERLTIAADYYQIVTGELDKAAQTFQQEIEGYPRAAGAYVNLGTVYCEQGQYEKATEITRQAVRLAPDIVNLYGNLATYALALQRFDEARQSIREAQARGLDNAVLHNALYALAFLGADSTAMAEQQTWFAGKPEENMGLALASDTEAYAGHLGKARELTKRAVDSAIRADSKENGAIWQAIAAQREAAYGNPAETRQSAAEALKRAPTSQGVESEAALAFAMAGDSARAESLAQNLGKRFPLDTQMQSLWLPAIQAQLALDRKNPAAALSVSQAGSPIELGLISFVANISCLYPVYVRGEAYLAAGQGSAAAAEFQKILDHSGIVWNCWTGALARLGVARSNTLQARTSQGADADVARVRALAAYKDFLALWKDADPDIPILKEAKAEYANIVIDEEWPAMNTGQLGSSGHNIIQHLWTATLETKAATFEEQTSMNLTLSEISSMTEHRRVRQLESQSKLPGILWMVLIVGGVITMLSASLFGTENFVLHCVQVGSLALLLSFILVAIADIDRPFQGMVHVDPLGFERARATFAVP